MDAQGQAKAAQGLYEMVIPTANAIGTETNSSALRPSAWQQQVAADVMVGAAQSNAAQHNWGEAEKLLSKVSLAGS